MGGLHTVPKMLRWMLARGMYPRQQQHLHLTEHIEKPSQDDRVCRLIRHPNGLVLIHDKDAYASAAAVDIAVGLLNDPVNGSRSSRPLKPHNPRHLGWQISRVMRQ